MRVHWLQHVAYEDLGNIEKWMKERGHTISRTRLYAGEKFPDTGSFDWLIVMGGPMNIYEEEKYPWLKPEKAFIKAAVKAGKGMTGICLGAQLLSDCLGGRVRRNRHTETGFFPVELTDAGMRSPLFEGVQRSFTAIHFHGDTFSVPPGAKRLAYSAGCRNQAFALRNGMVVGLQFHFEYSRSHIARYFAAGGTAGRGKYVQGPGLILANNAGFRAISVLMKRFLKNQERIILKDVL